MSLQRLPPVLQRQPRHFSWSSRSPLHLQPAAVLRHRRRRPRGGRRPAGRGALHVQRPGRHPRPRAVTGRRCLHRPPSTTDPLVLVLLSPPRPSFPSPFPRLLVCVLCLLAFPMSVSVCFLACCCLVWFHSSLLCSFASSPISLPSSSSRSTWCMAITSFLALIVTVGW